ncbi:MAG TPA: hypothetical protein VF177_12200 [Anaerolineae bacterium]
MSEETPSVEEIKERLKVEEITVEEEVTKEEAQRMDVAAELKALGRQFAETLETAWHSEERQRVEAQVREGMKSFADEVDKVIREIRTSPVAGRVKEEATEVKGRVESGDLGRKTRSGIVQGLRWLSEELDKLAEQFTPGEKSPAEEEADVVIIEEENE